MKYFLIVIKYFYLHGLLHFMNDSWQNGKLTIPISDSLFLYGVISSYEDY